MKIRVISVDPTVDKSINDFGHIINENGDKSRYIIRRNKIEKFISSNELGLDIEIFDAITPKDFAMMFNKIIFKGKEFISEDKSIFYAANWLSHYSIWLLDEDTLILEDDIELDVNLLSNINDIINVYKEQNKDNNGVLYLQRSNPCSNGVDKNLESMNYAGTGALFLTRDVKKVLLNNLKNIRGCDGYFDRLNKSGIIKYYIPNNLDYMFKLDKETAFL